MKTIFLVLVSSLCLIGCQKQSSYLLVDQALTSAMDRKIISGYRIQGNLGTGEVSSLYIYDKSGR